ncbi:AMP-binding protein [Streptomyces sp. SID5785]|uniref:AMP-binding protein n=1 Tax=Streptomyces sp. SID5785 TaxID=2690309 RepID=UPI001361CE50|nr:AMP-binding protein [Streptomyces sp. SID5785]MZD03948.1 AMP-binding protein [Streptomyces sp. SID5785]
MSPLLDGCTPWPEEFVDRYRSAGSWRGVTLDALLGDRARRHPTRTALVHGATRLTYGQLNRRVERTAAGFRLRGLRPGQRVVVRLPGVPEHVVTLFALLRTGAVPVVCPLALGVEELARVVRITEATGHVGTAGHRADVAAVAARGPFLRRAFTYEPPGAGSPYGGMTIDASGCHHFPLDSVESAPGPAPVRGAGEVAFLLLSAGPDGGPLLVPRTHDAYAYQVRAAGEAMGLGEDDVLLAALPAAALLATGCPGTVGTLLAGGTVVLADDPEPATCLPLVAAERVTCTTLTPDALTAWLDAAPPAGTDLGSLRLVQTGGAPVPAELAARVRPGLGCALQEFVALPEGVVALARPGAPAGSPAEGLSRDDEFRIAGPDGAEVPHGASGELLARGPSVPRGYYRAPDADARAFTADGRFRTGLHARRAAEGGGPTVVWASQTER